MRRFEQDRKAALAGKYNYLNPKKSFTVPSEYIKQVLMRGTGFIGGKGRVYKIFETEIDAGTRAKRIKAEYGQGGAGWPVDGLGLHGYDTFHGNGLRFQWRDEDGEVEGYVSWKDIEKELGVLILTGEYQPETPRIDELAMDGLREDDEVIDAEYREVEPEEAESELDDYAIPDEPESYASSRDYVSAKGMTPQEAADEDRMITQAEYGAEIEAETSEKDPSELQYITPIDYAKRIAELDEDLRDAAEILVTDCSCYTPFRASNGVEAKVATLGSKYEFFHEWKRLSEQEQGSVALETMLRGICKKENFLDLLENFILFDHSGGKTVKILARNHQYLGVNEAVKAYEARKLNNGKLGVFWHTQGSGKSYSMVFLSQKIRRKFAGSPTIVVLTDREELNTQISDTFENCGLLGKTKASKFIATSGEDLINKLKGNPSFIFTLIQKFNKKVDEPIIPDHDIIIMSDEAHRSQYGVFADNMVELLPTASRIGFTGTPLLSNDNITERTFGGYISIYDFKRAVEDKATVPLYYENRGEKILDINNPDITDKILDAIEAADLDPEQEEKLEHEFEKEIHLLTAEPRLKSVARDFVSHYSDLWTSGKAMFVCLNKVTCVRMYDFVQKYWQDDIKTLEKQIQTASQQEVQELERKLNWMKETEMAVVISQEQNEIQTFKKWNLDIKYHREKMEKRELDKEFKDKDNPLRVVFVCAMWLTGFDVKCLSCLYLDKPLKAHTLMQTIARANRVAEGKSNGLIIDYIGIVKALRKALADYTANVGGGSTDPTIDKGELIERVLETITAAAEFLDSKDFDLDDLVYAKDFAKISLLLTAANAVSDSRESKKQFMTYGNELNRMMKYLDRDDISKADRERKDAIIAIVDELKKKKKHVDNTDLMVQIS